MSPTRRDRLTRKILLLGCMWSGIAVASDPVDPIPRMWESDVGTSVEAVFIDGARPTPKGEGFVELQDSKGRTLRVRLNRLSKESADIAIELIEWQELEKALVRQSREQENVKEEGAQRQLRALLRAAVVSGDSGAIRDALDEIATQCILAAKDCPDLDYIAERKCFENAQQLRSLKLRPPRNSLVRKLQLDSIRLLGITRSRRSWHTLSQLSKAGDPVVSASAEEALARLGNPSQSERLWSKYFRNLVVGNEFLYFVPPVRMCPGEPPEGRSQYWLPEIWEVRAEEGLSAFEVAQASRELKDPKRIVDAVAQAIRLRRMVESKSSWPWFFGKAAPRAILVSEKDYRVGDRTELIVPCEVGSQFGTPVIVPCIPMFLSYTDFQNLLPLLVDPTQHVQGAKEFDIPEDLQKLAQDSVIANADAEVVAVQPSQMDKSGTSERASTLSSVLARSKPFRGKWIESEGVLRGEHSSATQLPVGSEGSYRFTVQFEKLGDDAVLFLLPVADTNVHLVLDFEHGKYHGFGRINGRHVGINPSRISAQSMRVNGRCSLQVHVQVEGDQTVLDAKLNGQELTKWRGAHANLASSGDWVCPDRRKIGIATTNCSVRVFDAHFETEKTEE